MDRKGVDHGGHGVHGGKGDSWCAVKMVRRTPAPCSISSLSSFPSVKLPSFWRAPLFQSGADVDATFGWG